MNVKLGAVSSNSLTSHLCSGRPVFAVIPRIDPTYTTNTISCMCVHYIYCIKPNSHLQHECNSIVESRSAS